MNADQPWTIRRLLEWTRDYLAGKGIESARLEAELLLAHALRCAKIALYTRYDEVPDEAQRAAFRELVQRRVKGHPVAYLLGKKEFFSLEFEVNPAVLIPRPDSEWLVSEVKQGVKSLASPRLLDVGTGSGCLAIALAVNLKTAQVTAIDRSEEALAVARRNAQKHQVSQRLRFLLGDLFAPVAGERFDGIVSNPPYIRTGDLGGLAREVRDFEPHLALDGGPDGFAVIDRLLSEAGEYLAPGGSLWMEIGFDQAEETQRRAAAAGWTLAKATRDAGNHVRVLCLHRP
ncbi:MAG: peptide chain release factor N(5)-glutamine methyltransferase [Gemmataceae bacterium]